MAPNLAVASTPPDRALATTGPTSTEPRGTKWLNSSSHTIATFRKLSRIIGHEKRVQPLQQGSRPRHSRKIRASHVDARSMRMKNSLDPIFRLTGSSHLRLRQLRFGAAGKARPRAGWTRRGGRRLRRFSRRRRQGRRGGPRRAGAEAEAAGGQSSGGTSAGAGGNAGEADGGLAGQDVASQAGASQLGRVT